MGQDDFPVTGVSWYEAAAYAEYAGKVLPTVYYWSRVAHQQFSAFFVPHSNFTGRGPYRVGASQGMNRFGAYDMAGNVKEWCWNAAGAGKRYILGGARNEPVYMFTDADARSPFDREATFGFRCAKLGPEALSETITGPIEFPSLCKGETGQPRSLHPLVGDEVYRIAREAIANAFRHAAAYRIDVEAPWCSPLVTAIALR